MMEVEFYVQTKLNELRTVGESRRVNLLMEAASYGAFTQGRRSRANRPSRVRQAVASQVVAAGARIERLGLWIAMEPRTQE